jgi:hypothetical protein
MLPAAESKDEEAKRLAKQARIRTAQDEERKRSRKRGRVSDATILAERAANPLLAVRAIADRLNVSERRAKRVLVAAESG